MQIQGLKIQLSCFCKKKKKKSKQFLTIYVSCSKDALKSLQLWKKKSP